MNRLDRTITPHRIGASLAFVLGLAACGPVTAPVTGAYGPVVSRPAVNHGAAKVEPLPALGYAPIKIEPLPAPGPEPARLPLAERPGAHDHVVQAGETIYSIARRYSLSPMELMRANTIPPDFSIKSGQRLVIPDGESAAPSATELAQPGAEMGRVETPAVLMPPVPPGPPAAAAAATSPPAVPDLALVPPIAPRGAEGASSPDQSTRKAALLATLTPPSRAGRTFQWPVKGRVISDYGEKGQGLRNDGINIAAPRGTLVLAAENGVVAYTGNELKGFGNLLLIRHADGWVTAYAHNEALLVARGEVVRRGQPIARVGMTGNVREPQLHFELRRNRETINPSQFLDGEPGRAERSRPLIPSASRAGLPGPG